MRLLGMVDALKAQEQDPASRELTFLERLVHNAHRIEMLGDSMRKNRGKPST